MASQNITAIDVKCIRASARKLLLDAEQIGNKALRKDIMVEAAAILALVGNKETA